jgi:predicted nucleic acid-binding Zn ribbon protein
MSLRRRAPRRVAVTLETLGGQWQPATLLAEVQQAWPGAVGEAIAREARPVAERGGVVTVTCSAAVWAQELDLMGPAIVERLNHELDRGTVRRLRCTAAP